MKENILIDKSICFAARIVKLHDFLIKNKKGTVVSLVPLSKTAHIVEGKGFKYSLEEIVLIAGESRGLSNVVALDEAEFTVAEGLCLVFEVCRP